MTKLNMSYKELVHRVNKKMKKNYTYSHVYGVFNNIQKSSGISKAISEVISEAAIAKKEAAKKPVAA